MTSTRVVVTTSEARAPTQPAEKAGEDRAEQRKEDDRLIHALAAQPLRRSISATSMVRRLRK